MAMQTTPHTQTQQNMSAAQDDLEPNQLVQDVGQGDDANLYESAKGTQEGGNRSFHTNDTNSNLPKVEPESAAMTGHNNARSSHEEHQGITDHSADEESVGQEKVVNERPDAQAGVDLTGHPVR